MVFRLLKAASLTPIHIGYPFSCTVICEMLNVICCSIECQVRGLVCESFLCLKVEQFERRIPIFLKVYIIKG